MNQRKQKTEFIRLVCRQAGEKVDEKMHWAKAGIENATQNITALASTTRGRVLGIVAGLSLAACSKEDDPMPTPDPQPTTKANTITVLQNPPTTVSGAVGDTLPFFHGKYQALKGNVAVNVQETEDPSNAIRILPHAHPDSTNIAFDKAATAKMEVKASSARQVEGDTTFSAEEFMKEITGQGVEPEITAQQKLEAVQETLQNANPVFNYDGPSEIVLPYSLTELPNQQSLILVNNKYSEEYPSPLRSTILTERDGKTVITYNGGPYRGGDLKLELLNGLELKVPNLPLDFSAENLEKAKAYLKNHFDVSSLRGEPIHNSGELGAITNKIHRWTTDIKMYMYGGSEEERDTLKAILKDRVNQLAEDAMASGLASFAPKIEFVNSLEESSNGNTSFRLTEDISPFAGGYATGFLGISTNYGGEITDAGINLYNINNRSMDQKIGTALHEMFSLLGSSGEIQTTQDHHSSVINQSGQVNYSHFGAQDRAVYIAHYADQLTMGDNPHANALQEFDAIFPQLAAYLRENP